MQPQPPPHPMAQLTTYELRDYRRQLERAVKTLPEHVPARAMLQQRLAEVIAEQDSRQQQDRRP